MNGFRIWISSGVLLLAIFCGQAFSFDLTLIQGTANGAVTISTDNEGNTVFKLEEKIIDPSEIANFSVSSHGMNMKKIAKIFSERIIDTIFIGIQPKATQTGTSMSAEVLATGIVVSELIRNRLTGSETTINNNPIHK